MGGWLVVQWLNPTLLKSKDSDSAKDLCLNAITYISYTLAPSFDDGLKSCEFIEEKYTYSLYSNMFEKIHRE